MTPAQVTQPKLAYISTARESQSHGEEEDAVRLDLTMFCSYEKQYVQLVAMWCFGNSMSGKRSREKPGLKWTCFDWLAASSFRFLSTLVIKFFFFFFAPCQLQFESSSSSSSQTTVTHKSIYTNDSRLYSAWQKEVTASQTVRVYISCFPLDPSPQLETPLALGLHRALREGC